MSEQVYEAYEERGAGWLTFVAVMLFAVGFFRIISAISYFADSHKINNLSSGLFSSHLWAWGLWDLLVAGVAILGGLSIFANNEFGRVIGYIFGVLVIVQGFTTIGVAPWYSAFSIAIGSLVVYGLATTPKEARV